jgi:phage shock protein PspC (stress-responsive transcriptional regulator)
MTDIDLKIYLEKIIVKLEAIEKKSESLWKSFFRGVVQGLGNVIGVAIVLVVIGWVLNAVGVIPAFQEQARELKQTLEEFRRIR